MSRSAAQRSDARVAAWSRASAWTVAALVLLVAAFLCWQSWPALGTVEPAAWFTDSAWQPTEGRVGLVPMVVGTLAVVLGSTLVTVPLGVLAAVFACFYAHARVAGAFRHVLGLMAGIPSVVYGFFGLVVLVPWISAWRAPGTSLLAGILVLAMMTLPTVALAAEAALRAVPEELLRAGAALGLGRRALAWSLAVPAARNGILVGALLQVARAIGETMVVVMVCGNIVQVPKSLFDPVRTLTANIALEMGYATELHRSALFLTGAVLLLLVLALVLVVERARGGRIG